MNLRGKIAFGIGAAGKDMVYSLTAYYLMYYYQDVLGLNPTFVGLILMIARIFDALNDPFMGVLVARTRTRWGRFRPWLFSGSVLNALTLYALFAAPAGEETGIMVWFTVVYLLWGITYTMLDIPFWSMIPAVAETSREREHLAVVGRACAGIGGAVIIVSAMMAVSWLGGGSEREGFRLLALIVSVLFLIAELICCLFMKEQRHTEMKTGRIRDMFQALFRNDQALIVSATIILVNLSMYTTSNLIIYFFKYDYGGEAWRAGMSLFTTIGGVALILGMMILYPLMRKREFPNERIFTLSIWTAVSGYIIMLVLCLSGLYRHLSLLYVPAVLVFAANGILSVLTTVFLANSVDYGELKTGRRDESMIFSTQTFVVKTASGLAVFITGAGLDLIGLTGNAEEVGEIVPQTASALMGLRLMITLLPLLGLVAAFLFFRKRFSLTDGKMTEIAEELKAKQNEC